MAVSWASHHADLLAYINGFTGTPDQNRVSTLAELNECLRNADLQEPFAVELYEKTRGELNDTFGYGAFDLPSTKSVKDYITEITSGHQH